LTTRSRRSPPRPKPQRARLGEPSLSTLVRDSQDARLDRVHVAVPGIVQTYDKANKVADVLPAINGVIANADGDIFLEDLPVIPNVPVAWYRGGGASFQMKLKPGDSVVLLFSEASYAIWRTTGKVSEPGDLARHDISYPWALPCTAPDADSAAMPTLDDADGARLDTAGTDLIRMGGAAADFLSQETKLQLELAKVTTWAALVVTALGALGQTVTPLAPFSSTATAKLKGE
jgi:hypothetical protein